MYRLQGRERRHEGTWRGGRYGEGGGGRYGEGGGGRGREKGGAGREEVGGETGQGEGHAHMSVSVAPTIEVTSHGPEVLQEGALD